MSRQFVLGDLHGRAPALIEVLDKCDFDRTHDTLIVLGDIVDGYPWVRECFDILDTIKNKVICRGNHDCLTPDAEILTQNGWKKYYRILKSDKAYSFDTENNVGKWMPITNVIVKEHDGEMITANTNRLKMKVTPTHRVLCKIRIRSGKYLKWCDEYGYVVSGKLKGSNRIRIPSCSSDNNTDFNINDDMIKLSAWILTDGGFDKRGGGILIYQSKPGMCKKIMNLLNNLKYKYSINTRTRNIKICAGKKLVKPPLPQSTFRICASDSIQIKKYISKKEEIPNWLFNLSDRQFKIFIDTIIDGDGSRYYKYNNGCKYDTTILYGTKKFLKNIQGLLVTKGYCATFATSVRGDYRLNICKRQSIEFDGYKSLSKENYKGKVWCIETPLTNFMVRYKGTCYFTGNSWAHNWMTTGQELPVWVHQGGYATLRSYDFDNKNVPESHVKMIETSKIYHIDSKNNIYCHGGFNPRVPIENQSDETILWDRTLCKYAHNRWLQKNPVKIEPYNKIFVGHTSTMMFHSTRPLIMGNVIMLDTGGGDIGKLTIMNVDTLEWWQSNKKTKVEDNQFKYG